jgi:hypothetical protein
VQGVVPAVADLREQAVADRAGAGTGLARSRLLAALARLAGRVAAVVVAVGIGGLGYGRQGEARYERPDDSEVAAIEQGILRFP